MATVLTTPGNLFNLIKGTLGATNDVITLDRLSTLGGVAAQVSGTFVGTVAFEATVDGTNWVAFNMTPSDSGTDVASVTAPAALSKANNGFASIRAKFTRTSGTAAVCLRAVQQHL